MHRKLLIGFVWLFGAVLIVLFSGKVQSVPSLLEEVIWICIALSVIVHFYSPKFSWPFAIGWILFTIGQLFDILDNFNYFISTYINLFDTPFKNVGMILIIYAMVQVIDQRKLIITQLNREIKAKEALQAQLKFDAYHDPLTHLGNRRACFERFSDVAISANKLFYFDLDNFKQANDKHGHLIGDEILVNFANSIKDEFGAENCFRIGGDEFVAFGQTVCDESLRQKLLHGLIEYHVGISIGAIDIEPSKEPDYLLHLADEKMYKDKSHKIFRASKRQ
ncbi:diguanylate cyclase/phosphodiesterase (GGDEF & EAL domains) with PAS/PAC sensor(s) [Pseudoalteromonas luteoviolacea B = ATCC 29581]|nr:diguanylate cyclase/phosphodiesterase (GGDEF & EAL domains) with PAS/PAC sensor(s) [Pseudoalteromonas luteoviolacea B = ATCC 29581]